METPTHICKTHTLNAAITRVKKQPRVRKVSRTVIYAKGRKDGVTSTVLHWSQARQEVSHEQRRRLMLVLVLVPHHLHCKGLIDNGP
jgi:hypothetical protein